MALARRNFPSHAILLATMAGTPLTLADTWDNSAGNAQWSTATNWADNTEPTTTDAVTFPSTIPLNQATVLMTTTEFCSTLTFNNDYTLQGGQMFIINGGVSVAGGRTATINTVINGSAGLAKTGFGTLRLIPTSSNAFSGPISITGINSTLYVRSNVALGNTANDIDINAGKLQLDGVTNPTFLITGRTITPGSSGGTIELLNNAFLDLNTALGANANPLTFIGQGTVELNTPSARTGSTFVNAVLLRIQSPTALGTPGSASLTNGAVLEINNGSGIFAGTVTLGAGTALRGGTGTHTFNGIANVNASITLNGGPAANDTIILGSDGADVLRLGAGATTTVSVGTVRLLAANSYSGGWTIANSVLEVGNPTALGTGTTPVTVNSSGRLRLNTPTLVRDITLNNPGGGIELLQDATVTGQIPIAPNAGFVPIIGPGREFTLSGSGSSMTFTGTAFFGGAIGVGSMRVTNGADVSGDGTRVNGLSGGPGRLTVSGAGSTWTNSDEMWIGHSGGTGALSVDAGGVLSCPRIYIAQQDDASATVTGAGSMLTSAQLLEVGFGGAAGTLSVLDGGQVQATQTKVGDLTGASGTVTVSGSGSSMVNLGSLEVGKSGVGVFSVAAGGHVSCLGLTLGDGAASSGSCTVSGGLSRLECGSSGVLMSQNGAASTLNLPGGIVDINGNITDAGAGVSTFILDAATLDMHNFAIGAGPSPIDNLQFRSGTLKNVTQINNGAGLMKTGPGVLYLNTPNAYGGPTTVTQGTLFVVNSTGSATSTGPLTVFNGATLSGPGRVGGNVNNHGSVAPAGFVGIPFGTLTMLGGYSQSASGALMVEIGSPASFDRLDIIGPASIDGTLNVALLNGYQPNAGDVFDILNASSIGGTFDTINFPPLSGGLEWHVEYAATTLRLVVGSACIADVDDGSFTGTLDGGVTIDDLLYYLFIFEAGDLASDVDDGSFTGALDGGVTIDDLLYFLFRFESGC